MTAGFSHLSVRGYRRLSEVYLPLRALNVLIGANGAGKSSVLDILALLADSAEGKLSDSLNEMGGLSSLLTADGKHPAMELRLKKHIIIQSLNPASVLRVLDYGLVLGIQGIGYKIVRETLKKYPAAGSGLIEFSEDYYDIIADESNRCYRHEGKFITPDWDYRLLETALSQTPKMYRAIESVRSELADISEIYHTLDVSPRAPVRLPQTLSPAQTPGLDGENLLSCLHTLRETARDRFEALEDTLKSAFPTFQRLQFPAQHGGFLSLGWCDETLTRPIYAHELSEGTLRFLWLAALLHSPGLPKVTLIDEPEVSLHPEMLRLLADLMREASERTQLIVATHSDRLVGFLNPDELVVCDHDEKGNMTTKRADELDLAAWMEDYTLDQLWSMGRLGGRA